MGARVHKAFLAFLLAVSCAVPLCVSSVGPVPEQASATIYVDGEPIENTWEPDDMVSTDIQGKPYEEISAADAPSRLMGVLSKMVTLLMPLVIIACVVILIFNAGRNMFVKPEQRTPIGDLIKNMFINFFWIFAAPVVVELIVFAVTNGETILFATLFE